MIKGKVEIIKDFGTSFEEVIYSDNNMIVDGAGEIISHMMTIPPDLNTISSASSMYDVSNFTIKAVSFGKAPLHYYYNAHQNSGAPKYGRTNASEVWVVATNSSGASSYTPPAYLPNAPVPTDTYLVNFNGITLPEEVVGTIINTIVEYVNTSGFTLGWGNNSTYPSYKIPTNIGLVSSIKAGLYHFVALDPSGTVSCWGGTNSYGETTVPALPPCIGVGATVRTSFAITSSYALSSWGGGGSEGGIRNYPSTYASAVSSVEGGNTFFVILKTDGTVSAWGSSSITFTQPPASIQGAVKKIKSNWSSQHAAAILNNNTVSAWMVIPGADEGQTNLTSIIGYSVASATKLSNPVHNTPLNTTQHNYLITGSSVFGWGVGTATVYTPAITTPGGITNVKKIAVSPGANTIVLKNDGTVSGWGLNTNSNVLGFSSLNLTGISDLSRTDTAVKFVTSAGYVSGFGSNSSVPAALQGVTSSVVQGNYGTYYLTNTGHVSSVLFGGVVNFLSALSAVPVALQGSCVAISFYDWQDIRCVAAGIRSDGKPFLWGNSGGFQNYIPPTLSSVSSIVVGLATCVALKTNGQVSSWNNLNGTEIAVPTGLQSSCVGISLYKQVPYGIRSDGAIFKWNGPSDPIHTIPNIPIYTDGLSSVKDVATGQAHTLVLKTDGTVSAYGRNVEGQCNVPNHIQGITEKIFAAATNSYAILNDGRGVAWGYTTPTLSDPAGLLTIPNDDSGNRKFYDFAINYQNAVGLYSSSVAYYTTITTTEEADNSFYNSENFRQNTNLIPFKNNIVNKINVLNQTIDVIPSTVGALLDGTYPPSGGINVRIVSGFEPYTTVVSANVSGNFNTVGSMDFRGYVNVTSGTDPLKGLVTSSVNVSSNGELIYIVTIASGDCTLANLYGGVTQLGLWSYDLNKNIELGYNPPYAFRRYPEQTGTYLNPLRYKLFAKKVFNENILKIKDNGTTAGLKNHQNLTVRWRLYFA